MAGFNRDPYGPQSMETPAQRMAGFQDRSRARVPYQNNGQMPVSPRGLPQSPQQKYGFAPPAPAAAIMQALPQNPNGRLDAYRDANNSLDMRPMAPSGLTGEGYGSILPANPYQGNQNQFPGYEPRGPAQIAQDQSQDNYNATPDGYKAMPETAELYAQQARDTARFQTKM